MPGPSAGWAGGRHGVEGGWVDINIHIDINLNIDIQIIINLNKQYWYPQALLAPSGRTSSFLDMAS